MTDDSTRNTSIGLQAERTALAWQRTTLSLAVTVLIGARLAFEVVDTNSFILGALGLFPATAAIIIGGRRYLVVRSIRVYGSSGSSSRSGAVSMFTLSSIVLALSVATMFFVIMRQVT